MPDLRELADQLLHQRFAGQVSPQFFRVKLTLDEQVKVRGKPRPYIEVVLQLLKAMKADTIVEVGSARQPLDHPLKDFNPVCCNDGHSSMYWASSGLDFHTVDINPEAGKAVTKACGHLPNVHVYTEDGIGFLKRFPKPIDLLFLDAWDVVEGSPFAEKHLEAWQTVRGKMKPTSLVLIDDTDIMFGGKGRLCIPAMIRDGYDPLINGRQTLLMRVAG
jgi:hypothetical protein